MDKPQPDAGKAAEFRQKAKEATDNADAANDVFIRGYWLTIARAFREMADRADGRHILKLKLE